MGSVFHSLAAKDFHSGIKMMLVGPVNFESLKMGGLCKKTVVFPKDLMQKNCVKPFILKLKSEL